MVMQSRDGGPTLSSRKHIAMIAHDNRNVALAKIFRYGGTEKDRTVRLANILTRPMVTVLLAVSACSTSFPNPDQWAPEDLVTFVVRGSGETESAPGIPGIDVFLVGDDWATRVDRTDESGRWTVSSRWLDDARLILFCWPDGPFDCAVVTVEDCPHTREPIAVNLPEAIRTRRSAGW